MEGFMSVDERERNWDPFKNKGKPSLVRNQSHPELSDSRLKAPT